MAKNSVNVLNGGVTNTTAANEAANTSIPNTTANANATNDSVTALTQPADWVADFCAGYGQTLLWLAVAFLGAALLLGIASSIIALLAVRRQGGGGPDLVRGNILPDPAKLVDALKGLIDALAKAPAWIAILVGGILLLWMAGTFAGSICVPPDDEEENEAVSNVTNATRTTTNTTTTNTSRTATGTTTGNSQGTVTNSQGRPGG